MANEKKIAKSQKLLLYQLGEALKLEEKLNQEPDSKKQAKIQKKIESSNKMILYYGKNIGQEGGTLESIWDQLTERQQQIIQELFPYGIKSDELAQQEKRLQIINAHKNRISKLKKIEESCPPYDPSLPFKEKLKNKRFKMEKEIGWWLVVDSKKGNATYEPVWNYEEHFANTVEFSEEERQIVERCYQIGKEYDEYNNQKFAFVVNLGTSMVDKTDEMSKWGDRTQSKVWCRNMYTKTFPKFIKQLNPSRKYTAAELEHESKEMMKRFIKFARDEDGRSALMREWHELLQKEELAGMSQDQREELVMNMVGQKIGEEMTVFLYVYDTADSVVDAMELIKKHSFEELGLE